MATMHNFTLETAGIIKKKKADEWPKEYTIPPEWMGDDYCRVELLIENLQNQSDETAECTVVFHVAIRIDDGENRPWQYMYWPDSFVWNSGTVLEVMYDEKWEIVNHDCYWDGEDEEE